MATIRDVAAKAGVSIATVSHVVNGTRRVAPETAQRVRAAMEDLQYRPVAAARQLRLGDAQTVGLLISDIDNPFFPEAVSAFEKKAIDAGVEVLLGNTGYDPERCTKAVERLLDARVKAVAVLASEPDPESFVAFEKYGVPLLLLDRSLGESGPVLRIDYETGLELAVDHLYDLGHRRIAFVGGPDSLYSARLRLEGFENACARRDGIVTTVIPGDFRVEGGRAAAAAILGMDPRPTAVVCGNDIMALALMSGLSIEGLHVPEALSVVGFDGIAFGRIAAPPLTTVSLDPRHLSELAFHVVKKLVDGDDDVGDVTLKPKLRVGGTTAPLRD